MINFYNPMKKKEESELRWMEAKYTSKCSECGERITEGEQILYDFKEGKAFCESCGEEWLIK